MKSCVVFAVSIFDKSKLHVLREYLNVFNEHYNQCDFYIGINYPSISEVEDEISSYGLSTYIVRVPNHLYCESDASAYQSALQLLKNSNKRYDVCWFAHTKGGVNHRPSERNLYLTHFFSKKAEIESAFMYYKHLGIVGLRGVSTSAAGDNWATFNRDHIIDVCSNQRTLQLPFTHVNWSYIETMYAINGKVIDTFFDVATDEFFDTKIQERCYFEVIFPWIPTRCGYFPCTMQKECYFNNSISLTKITESWVSENNLQHLNNYIGL